MIAAWMLYALLVSVMTAAGAWLLEGAVRMRGGPVRVLWIGALLAALGLVALAPLRMAPPAPASAPGITVATFPDATADVRPAGMAERALAALRSAVERPLREAARLGSGTAGQVLLGGWALASATLLLVGAATTLRARRARHAWPRTTVAGEAVRVAPGMGPAVLGIVRPEVVVPAWLLDATEDEQRLVVLHEREHVRAGDPLLLAVGCAAAALLPWSPAAWWMLLRLRAAVELDCDARVLRGGVPRRAYGSLLIEMAGRGPGLSLGTPALAGSPSTLERRLRAMNAHLPRFARARAGLFGVLGLALVAAACDTPLPTTAEVQRMDVAALEARTLELRPGGNDQDVTYYVDDRQVTADEAHALVGDRVVRMDVSHTATGGSVVRVYTTPEAPGEPAGEAELPPAAANVQAGTGESGEVVQVDVTAPGRAATADGFGGLLVIDGVISGHDAMARLAPDGIAQVEVIKGDAARRLYDDPRAANGVIRITTKPAGTP